MHPPHLQAARRTAILGCSSSRPIVDVERVGAAGEDHERGAADDDARAPAPSTSGRAP